MANNHIAEMEKRLWDVADELRANSDLKSSEYSTPVLGLIFLRYADYRFTEQEKIFPKRLLTAGKSARQIIRPRVLCIYRKKRDSHTY